MKIGFIGAKEAGISLLRLLSKNGVNFDIIVTIKYKKKQTKKIAGYGDLSKYALQNKIKILKIENYSFSKTDIDKIKKLNIDLFICFGWQRIIPKIVLDIPKYGFFGFHGSYLKLPDGRGRSPFNWTIRKNKKNIFYNLFKYTEDFDLGPIYLTKKIKINESDNVNILIKKSILLATNMIKKLILDLNKNKIKLNFQKKKKAYIEFKKIDELDCKLDFKQNIKFNITMIKASSRPFKGAYAYTSNKKIIYIYEAYITDFRIKNGQSGYIHLVLDDLSFYLQIQSEIILVTNHSMGTRVKNLENTSLY